MDGQATQVDAVYKGTAFEALKVIIGLAFHLSMKYLDAVKAHAGSFFDTGFNGEFQVSFESPKRVCGYCYRIRAICGFGFAGRGGIYT